MSSKILECLFEKFIVYLMVYSIFKKVQYVYKEQKACTIYWRLSLFTTEKKFSTVLSMVEFINFLYYKGKDFIR